MVQTEFFFKARKILVYIEVHEFSETAGNSSECAVTHIFYSTTLGTVKYPYSFIGALARIASL